MKNVEGKSKKEIAFQACERKLPSLDWWKKECIFMKDLIASERILPSLLKSLHDFQVAEDDKRSVFVENLYFSFKPEDLLRLFESCETVSEVIIPTDDSGRWKGCAIVEFIEVEAVQKALLLNGTQLCGRQIRVGAVQKNNVNPKGGGKAAASKFQKPAAHYQPY